MRKVAGFLFGYMGSRRGATMPASPERTA